MANEAPFLLPGGESFDESFLDEAPSAPRPEGLPLPAGPMSPPVPGLPMAARAPSGFGEVDGDLPAAHALGLSFLIPGIATVVGYKYGGPWGSAAGAFAGGAAVNGIHAVNFLRRKTPEAKHQAMISGVYAAVGLGCAGWILMERASKASKGTE